MPDTDPEAVCCRSSSVDDLFDCLLAQVQEQPSVIPVITGPTATGKSALAMRLARAVGGQIVSVDAMQVYRGFDIGTAKASREDRAAIAHHLIDILDPCERISVASYLDRVTRLLARLVDEGHRPILCGGSVQYVSALLDGLEFIDCEPDLELRKEIGLQIDREGQAKAWDLIRQLDPLAASAMAPGDRRRMIRFFELYYQTGLTKTELNQASRARGPLFSFLAFWLNLTPRQALYDRIDRRVEAMYQAGLIDEVRDLMGRYPSYERCPAFRGIGYREVVCLLEGKLTEEESRELTARSTRRYAKRQQTWLRRRRDLRILLLDANKSYQRNILSTAKIEEPGPLMLD